MCHLNENSPQGAALVFSDAYSTQVHDDDMVIYSSRHFKYVPTIQIDFWRDLYSQGKQGVFSLILEKNNGTFEISPNVIERKAYFTIRVRNNLLLDYESRKSVEFVVTNRSLVFPNETRLVSWFVYLFVR